MPFMSRADIMLSMDRHQDLIRILDNADGFLSGEEIGGVLSLSRMSISNMVRDLQKDGYYIEKRSGVGYRLFRELSFTKEMVEKEFEDIVPVYFFQTLEGSSNNYAKKLLSEGTEPPFVVVTRSQSGGKGRLGRSFSSPEGGVYFSLVLPGRMLFESADHITTSSSLATAKALEELTGIESRIKWVNDIYIGGKKAVGILSEGIVDLELGGLSSAVIGVGINLNTPLEAFPEELRVKATSYYLESGKRYPYVEVLSRVVKGIIGIQNRSYLDEYRGRCFIIGKDVRILSYGKDLGSARCIAVDDDAHLVVILPSGEIKHLSSGEVTLKL